MSSREKILGSVKKHQPEATQLPDIDHFHGNIETTLDTFRSALVSIGGEVHVVKSLQEAQAIIELKISPGNRIVTTIDSFSSIAEEITEQINPHGLENVYLAIIKSAFAVAENGAVWITSRDVKVRALPFICEHLAVIVSKDKIVPTLHEAYTLLEISDHDFGTFIAGPSKTADIEQSLVLGAHGSKSMSVYIVG